MKKLHHSSLIRLFEILETDDIFCLVMELCDKDLLTHLTTAGLSTEFQARTYGRQLISAFEYLHSKDIVHRDLKPENMMIDRVCQRITICHEHVCVSVRNLLTVHRYTTCSAHVLQLYNLQDKSHVTVLSLTMHCYNHVDGMSMPSIRCVGFAEAKWKVENYRLWSEQRVDWTRSTHHPMRIHGVLCPRVARTQTVWQGMYVLMYAEQSSMQCGVLQWQWLCVYSR